MKSWLRAAGEVPTGNTYAEWVKTQDESYLANQAARLVGESPNGEATISPEVENLKSAKWQLALDDALEQLNLASERLWNHWEVPAVGEATFDDSVSAAIGTYWRLRASRQAEIDACITSKTDTTFIFDRPAN